ncbi:MAG: hypothetical protein CVT65_02825 [Actinobacteria bacterium HGW-Actinobacteria-5]|jgi:hypothetical protein|nr:MAG: hypothetical protein CVT65_02825 [Actinobacteria bacterium HGW-Actinobacteria-5]
MNLGGWQYPIVKREWTDLLDEYRSAAENLPALAPLVSIIESVIQNQMQDQLAATTSMWDLVITTAPPGEPPLDVIVVRSSVSMNPPRSGEVRIEQFATSGLKEELTRSTAEVLPLFWRFILEKYGLKPT